jgi:hypothetical protein
VEASGAGGHHLVTATEEGKTQQVSFEEISADGKAWEYLGIQPVSGSRWLPMSYPINQMIMKSNRTETYTIISVFPAPLRRSRGKIGPEQDLLLVFTVFSHHRFRMNTRFWMDSVQHTSPA